jgi:D-alanine-D-alanine ligase
MSHNPYRHIGVLMGGPSAEREVSLRSGAAVSRGLRTAGYEVVEIVIEGETVPPLDGIDAVFIAMHGPFGEDGRVQGILRDRRVPYAGAGPEASALAMDKIATKQCLERQGIQTPAFEVRTDPGPPGLALPVVVKPNAQGSSISVHRVAEPSEWDAALADALSCGDPVLVESFIEGAELTVGLVGDEVLPVIEIRAPEGNYSYHAKYTPGTTEYLVPAPISEEQTRACQSLALATHRALGCEGMSRVDFRMTSDGDLYVLELNSIPGFTETSLLPKAAAAAGIDFPALCRRIIETASIH